MTRARARDRQGDSACAPRRRLEPGVAIVAVALTLAGCTGRGTPTAPSSRPTVVSTTAGSASSPTSTPTPYPASAVRTASVGLGGGPLGLVAAGDALYALGLSASAGAVALPASATIVRLDVGRRREAARAVMARPVVAGSISAGSLYVVLSDVGSGRTSPAGLVRLDASSLQVRAQTMLAAPDPSVVARPDGVYVLDGPRLERRDPHSLALTASLQLPFPASPGCPQQGGAVAADPRTNTGWVAITQESGGFRVAEIDLARLSLVHVSRETGGICGARVSAMLDGVWAGFATGLLSDAERFATATGETDAQLHSGGNGRVPEPNSAVYQVSATALWVSGGQALSCADLHTGRVLASTDLDQSSGGVAMVADRAYVAVAVYRGIDLYAPTQACR